MFWALKKSRKDSLLASKILNFEFPIDVLQAYSLLLEADFVCHKSNVKQFLRLKTVKHMLCSGNVLFRYVPIYNLQASFNFHLTFLPLTVIKMFTVQ